MTAMTMSEKMITMRQTSCRSKLARPMRLSILVDARPRGQMYGASAHATLLQSTTASASPVCIGHHVRSPGRSFRVLAGAGGHYIADRAGQIVRAGPPAPLVD